MTVYLRADESPPDDATALIHMGAGHARDVIRSAVRNDAAYKVLRNNGYGYFTVSVYAIEGEVDERRIVTTMHLGLFARGTAGAIRAVGFALLPTSDDDLGDEAGDEIRAIRRVHYDVVLPLTVARHVPISYEEYEDLHEGDEVLVIGDDLPKRSAVVERIDISAADTFQAAVVDLRFYPDDAAAVQLVRERAASQTG